MKSIKVFGETIESITYGGKTYKLSDISRIELKNGIIVKNRKDLEFLFRSYMLGISTTTLEISELVTKNAKF